jgi:hypothetical protein
LTPAVVPGALQHGVVLRRTGTSFLKAGTRFRVCGRTVSRCAAPGTTERRESSVAALVTPVTASSPRRAYIGANEFREGPMSQHIGARIVAFFGISAFFTAVLAVPYVTIH